MASDGDTDNKIWPMPKFHFEVDLGAELNGAVFQEVSGMDKEAQVIEYRQPSPKSFSTIKMPGIAKFGSITMRRGIFVNDNSFWDWVTEIKMNTIKRRTVLIKLLDENGKVTLQWHLNNAWPTKITSADLKSTGNEVAVDTLEIAHEALIITQGQ